jgi:lantibiotic transport system permease protein
MNQVISLRSEILKTKRTAAFYLTIIAGAFGPLMSLLDLSIGEGISADDGNMLLSKLMIGKFQMTGTVMFPMFIILICTLLPQIEYKNNTWKQVLTSPQSKANVFISKYINVHLLILLFLLTNKLVMFLNVLVLHFRYPALNVLSQPLNTYDLIASVTDSYIALLAILSIQFWLGLRFKNFIVPIAIGIAAWFLGTILVFQLNSGLGVYFPYSFHVYSNMPQYKHQVAAVQWTSVVYAIVFLILAYVDFVKREKK